MTKFRLEKLKPNVETDLGEIPELPTAGSNPESSIHSPIYYLNPDGSGF